MKLKMITTKKIYFNFSILFLISFNIMSQTEVLELWGGNIPNQEKSDEKEIQETFDVFWVRNVQNPVLEVFLPSQINSTGYGVVICPGGGYWGLAYNKEGIDFAKWLVSNGIAAFVLKYRLPNSKSLNEPHKAPLLDAQRALRLVRYHREKWNIDENKIGVLGFSAGGHVASTLGTKFNDNLGFTKDSIDTVSARPDFMALIYPVITMDSTYTHDGSKNNLLGKNPSKELVNRYSNELHVNSNTPPTFLVHASDDNAVPVDNSLLFYKALQENKVYSEVHIYPFGGHGFAFAKDQDYLATWTDRLIQWIHKLD